MAPITGKSPHPGWRPVLVAACLLISCIMPFQPAQPRAAGFPRLGMWYPDLWGSATVTQAARYDYLILGDSEQSFLPDLRAANPDQLQLLYQDACELGYVPGGSAQDNAQVLAIPHQWFLTQVGSTITAPITVSQTTIPVANVVNPDGSATFIAGDTVLIAGETVLVTAVDANAGILTVQRGYVRPASPHAAGTRIAAHISFWPSTWLLNVSTYCPAVTVDSAVGPETWAHYRARHGLALVVSGGWDGLLIDRGEGTQSWLVGTSTARTIDPDGSNSLPVDYTAFDREWGRGIRAYHEQLRAGLGDMPILVNWGMPNYDLLNGNNFETFPHGNDGRSFQGSWYETVFGGIDGGGYLEWLERAHGPNLSMIETYEDDIVPEPTGGGTYANPCVLPGFVPDYRKMRFGLTTALLGDGYFSYEMNTNGHGSLCLMWFDEYDNAGTGRGYLGQPLGSAVRVLGLTSPELIGNGGFESGWGDWSFWMETSEGCVAARSLDAAAHAGQQAARVDVSLTSGVDWQVQLSYAPVGVVLGKDYTLSFWARADRSFPFSVSVQENREPWTSYAYLQPAPLATDWRYYEIPFTAEGSDAAAVVHFSLGGSVGTVWLDDVSLKEGSSQLWRRDFDNGISLVNATGETRTVTLEQPYRKISGIQAPAVNTGEVVSQVTLPPRDGIILLRDITKQLGVTVTGGGSGAVSSTPAGIGCVSGVPTGCVARFTANDTVCLAAEPDWKSAFVGWSGDSAGSAPTACLLMDRDKNVTASFDSLPRVRVLPAGTLFAGIQEAYDLAAGGSRIQARAFDFPEDLLFGRESFFTLEGGLNAAYGTTDGYTTLRSLLIGRGAVTVSNVAIR